MRKLGVCTWTFGDQPLAVIAQALAEMGFEGVELMGDLGRYTAADAKTILGNYGLEVFSLTPDNADLSHPDAAVRRAGVGYFKQLLDFAAELGNPLVSCHGLVGRIAPLATQAEEDAWLVESVREIAEAAAERGLRLVFEVLNRYESHQICTGAQAVALIEQVGMDNIGVLLDAYHMNIEEADPAAALRAAGERLWLYHAADSHRGAVGSGHTDFAAQLAALDAIGYGGPIILECTAPGPNPFTPMKAADSLDKLKVFLQESRAWLRSA